MTETIIITFIIAAIKKISFKGLYKEWPFYPVITCATAYIFLQKTVFLGDYSMLKYTSIYKVIYTASIFYLILHYKIYKQGYIGIAFMFIGFGLNKFVMYQNGGKMPVYPSLTLKTGYITLEKLNSVDSVHILGNSSTKWWFLSDIFDIGYSVMSIGDVFVRVFLGIVIYYSLVEFNRRNKKEAFI